jgi:Tfp pilus assembly protein PilF
MIANVTQALLGQALAQHGSGNLAGALRDYRNLIALLPSDPTAYVNGAVAWTGLGNTDMAQRYCRVAERLLPDHAIVHRVSGEIWALLGAIPLADAAFRRAMVLQPDAVEISNNFGNFLATHSDERAIRHFRHALVLWPDLPETHANLAASLLTARLVVQSMEAACRAIMLAPDRADSYNNLGNVCLERRQYGMALACFSRARRLRPDHVTACINQSGLLIDLGRTEAGADLARLAVAFAPHLLGPYNNLANGELLSCRLRPSEQVFRRALLVAPEDAQTHFNFAATLLKQGKMSEGWAEYEWRRRTPAALERRKMFDPKEWQGGALAGARLLLSAEQGYGDALQFCRFAIWLADQGAHITLRVPPALLRLMRRLPASIAVIGMEEPLPDHQGHLPLMSVPFAFPAAKIDPPYLAADPAQSAVWRRRLAELPGRKVGLVWAGAPRPDQHLAHLLDRRRSMALSDFAGLSESAGITFVSLQKGDAAGQAATLPAGLRMVDWTRELQDFADSADLVSALDLIISVDTSVAHLAGALGRPVWLLSRFDGCWRWQQGQDRTDWYPAMRLFRQTRPNDWSAPLAALSSALRQWNADT